MVRATARSSLQRLSTLDLRAIRGKSTPSQRRHPKNQPQRGANRRSSASAPASTNAHRHRPTCLLPITALYPGDARSFTHTVNAPAPPSKCTWSPSSRAICRTIASPSPAPAPRLKQLGRTLRSRHEHHSGGSADPLVALFTRQSVDARARLATRGIGAPPRSEGPTSRSREHASTTASSAHARHMT